MKKTLYFEPLYSDRREKLIDLCADLQRQGKNFIYILPSREALGDVRMKFIKKLGGIINSKIIMFDELEKAITEEFVCKENIIDDQMEAIIIKKIDTADNFLYFTKICTKDGFIEEATAFIKYLKRNCITEQKLGSIIKNITDKILKNKLHDMAVIYSEYNKYLSDNELYDVNDISLLAVYKVKEYTQLKNTSAIIIDGFINIDKVNQELIKKIAQTDSVSIYVNCSYVNEFNLQFLKEEILDSFEAMGFEVNKEAEGYYASQKGFRELSEKLYSGKKLNDKPEHLSISKYPCIAAEVRETARDIKAKIIMGAKPEEIAVFVNNRDSYQRDLWSIFSEYKIPIFMNYEIPLSDADLCRNIISKLKNSTLEIRTADEGIDVVQEELQLRNNEVVPLLCKAFNEPLSFEDKLYIKAFEGIKKLVSDMRINFNICGIINSSFEKDEFIRSFTEVVKNTTVTIEKGNSGGVKIINTDLAKGVFYKHVYVLGLNEGEVPNVIKNDGLFDESEVITLKSEGISFEDYLWELCREKIRFNLCLFSARETIALSYRSAEEDGKFAIPSSFIEEVKFITGLKESREVTMRSRFEIPYSNVMSEYELSAMKLKNYFEEKYGASKQDELEKISLADEFESNIGKLVKNGEIEYHREKENIFNEYEGNVGEVLIEKGMLSPSKLNEYLKCPFGYMLKYIFSIKETPEEDEDELSAIEIGDLYHKALYYYYDGLDDFEGLDVDKFEAAFEKACEEIDKTKLTDEKEIVKNFIICDLIRINKFEKSSGNIIRPYVLEQFIENDMFGINITCRIDRVDLEYKLINGEFKPTGKYIVYDYKKRTSPQISDMLEKKNCQIAFYYYFVQQYLKEKLQPYEPDCMALLYFSVENTDKSVKKDGLYRTEFKKEIGFTGNSKFDMDSEMFYTFLEFLKEVIEQAIENIKEGHFPYSFSCSCFESNSHSSCYFKDTCRYSRNKINAYREAQ